MPTTDLSRDLQIEIQAYPLDASAQQELVQLLRTEWSRTDYDWIEAMQGDYSDQLTILTAVARRQGEAVATATVHFHRARPEVAVIGGVLTRRVHRGVGIGGRVVGAALGAAQEAGCVVCLLGTAKTPRNLYSINGFAWINGHVMRRLLAPAETVARVFAAGQSVALRPAGWGDLPGLTHLVAQPLGTACLDFPRGLYSGRYVPAERCLSNFPVLWYDTVMRGGALWVLGAEQPGRVLGFGSVTRGAGPARRHAATVDFCTHDHYLDQMPALLDRLLERCAAAGVRRVEAWTAESDGGKAAVLRAAGFAERGRWPGTLQWGGGAAALLCWDMAI